MSGIIMQLFTRANADLCNTKIELIKYGSFFENEDNVSNALHEADEILKRNREIGVKTVYYTSSKYPLNLSKIVNPPAIIYYIGNEFDSLSDSSLACVGTRKPTRLSYNAVNYIIPQLVCEKCSIVSGLAMGVDALAHQACLSARGKTVAVVAHGLDMIYPKDNSKLAKDIVKEGGIIMSEYPIGTKPDRYRFINRNRLIIGMSKAVVIFECDARGGTMHSAKYAQQQDKPIFCPALGNEILDIQTGTHQLLQEGIAHIINNGRDINGIFSAMNLKMPAAQMKGMDIKKIYLYSLLERLDDYQEIKEALCGFNIAFSNKNLYYDLLNAIEKRLVRIDDIINRLIDVSIDKDETNN